jgi:hypothetical protein
VLGGDAMRILLQRYEQSDRSIESVVSAARLAYASHFRNEPLAAAGPAAVMGNRKVRCCCFFLVG